MYSCLARLSKHSRFYDRLVFSRGISILVGETRARRYKLMNLNRRERLEVNEELRSQIESLEITLKFDIYCILIQAVFRGYLLRKARRRRRGISQSTGKVGKM